MENYPVKSFYKNNYKKTIINDEEYEDNDINSLYNDKNDIFKNIIYNGNKKNGKIFNKYDNKEYLNNSNIINNYISKKLYANNEEKSINDSYKDFSEDINEKIEKNNKNITLLFHSSKNLYILAVHILNIQYIYLHEEHYNYDF